MLEHAQPLACHFIQDRQITRKCVPSREKDRPQPGKPGQRLTVAQAQLGDEIVVVEQAGLVDPAGQRLRRLQDPVLVDGFDGDGYAKVSWDKRV